MPRFGADTIPQIVVAPLQPDERIADWAPMFTAAVSGLLAKGATGQRLAIGLLPAYLTRSVAERELVREIVSSDGPATLAEAFCLLKALDPPINKFEKMQELYRLDWRPGTLVDDFFYQLKRLSKDAGNTDSACFCNIFVSQMPKSIQAKVKEKLEESMSESDARNLLSLCKEVLAEKGIALDRGYRNFERVTGGGVAQLDNEPTSSPIPPNKSVQLLQPFCSGAGYRGRGRGQRSDSTRFRRPQLKSDKGPQPSSQQRFYRFRGACFVCNETGHMMKDCPYKRCARCGETGHALLQCPLAAKSLRKLDTNVQCLSNDPTSELRIRENPRGSQTSTRTLWLSAFP